MNSTDKICTLPDIQGTEPNLSIPIQRVGVENVEVPFKLESKYGGFHEMVANVSMGTNLDKSTKGISMSRLIRTLKPYLDLPLKSKLIREILEELQCKVGGTEVFIKFDFKLPRKRESLISKNRFPIYYKCKFQGELLHTYAKINSETAARTILFRFFQGVTVQYASYCPCSAELCNALDGQGFPHNQRSFAHVLIESDGQKYLWLEEIIEAIESVIPTLPYPIIKRVDEQEIGRIAAQNPMFVEDAIRVISNAVNSLEGVRDWIVKCSHEESIHTSEAIAINWKGILNGFDGRRFI
jgi:GTP cyclohydrolase I